jgi:hypothetical protein
MTPVAVVEHFNVIEDISSGSFSGAVTCATYTFCLNFQRSWRQHYYAQGQAAQSQQIPIAAHAADHGMAFAHLLEIIAAILAATI